MEEDIEIIEDNIDMFMDTLYECYRQSKVKPFEKAIKNLIARNKELEKDYIPKSKIKEKIEELENYIQENSDEQGYWGSKNQEEIYEQIEVLQELLD